MFGESESESPRVPSPWDVVLAPASIDKLHYCQDEILLPKLSAEVEEGNVEYKLHLINPSTARFARLVTQMKWRLLEGGGQAIYELGVADSGALVGLAPDDRRASLDTLYAMAAEIGACVTISKEIEVTVTDVPEVGLRAQVDKRHGGRDTRRAAVKYKNNSRAQALPIEATGLYSFVPTTSTSTPSSLDSTASFVTDSCSVASDSSTLSSPSLPASSVNIRETVHSDDPLLFLMLTDSSPRYSMSAESVVGGGESLIGHDMNGILEKSLTGVESRLDTCELHCTQHEGGTEHEQPGAIVVTAVDALPDPTEVLQTEFSTLQVADNPPAPEGHKRTIVEALVTRELDKEEGFLDFASF